ncbi:efflux RND transporter periplasmic adaptor subunit [Pseudoalteromonas sp. Isolate6]|uniref:efflux RND transporter periplasmic adaptor subunit n=1 Tax=Pseudoalteromonas sp. Isolate6 TaxID=2908527 RepID=UPI001EFEB99E|nr:efflux RND transporter periplasmic adaptor subunit [Pseudoalteromonas sp. Isolate6]MCG9757705.1 efflux RND transporter periplasmic adaptor subunit [Pseudoalteromonas sp. Isolate6]
MYLFRISSCVLAGFLTLQTLGCGSAAPSKENTEKKPQVSITRVDRGKDYIEQSYLGYVRAHDRGELSFEGRGKIVSLDLDIGDSFEKGDVLSRLDSVTSKLALKEAEASLNQARYDLENAKIEFERRKALSKRSLVSDTEVDLWKLKVDSAFAQVNLLEAKRDTAKKGLADTQIIAPFDGSVTGKFAQKNQHVSANQAVLSVKSDNTTLEVLTRIPYQHVNQIKVGQQVSMYTLEKNLLSGVIKSINRQASANGLIEALIILDNKFTDLVVPGAPVNVSFSIRNARNNYSIPIAALYRDTRNNHFVWLLDPKTQTVFKKVVLIERIRSGRVFVSGDLDENSNIVMHGGQGLANGQVVELVNS